MTKRFNNIFRILFVVLIALFAVTGCKDKDGDGGGDGGETPTVITRELLEALPFEDLTVKYDGQKHSILIDNIYESQGVTITYTGNEQNVPGQYNVSASIKYTGIKTVYKKAVLTIEKGDSILEAPLEQTFNLKTGTPALIYSNPNNTRQTLVVLDENKNQVKVSDLVVPGVYNLEVYFAASVNYKESEHKNIVFTVIESLFDVSFVSKTVVADGNTHSIELSGSLPSGYTVEYENNSGSVDGKYYALANIKDSSGKIVETHRAVLEIDNPEHEEFATFIDEFFVWYLEGDQLAVNIFCENPYDFGLEHYDAQWYTYEAFGDEEIAHDLQLFKDLLVDLEEFKDVELNNYQDVMYETLRKFLEYNVTYYGIEDVFFMELRYIDQFGGYVADFGTYMESYSLRSEAEVKDIVAYINSTEEAFPSYLDYIEVKTEKGYPLSNYTINEMRSYLKDILDQGDEYYLEDIINEKIEKLDFLSNSKKSQYMNEVSYALENNFMNGVQSLYDGLADYLDVLAAEDEGYIATYENGEQVYVLELQNLLGYESMDMDAYIKELDYELKAAIRNVISAQNAIVSKYNISDYAQLTEIVNSVNVGGVDVNEMMEYVKEFAKTIVPDLQSNPDIVIKYMDTAAAKKSNAVAYYMKSALDNTGSEYVTLNPVQLKTASSMDTLGTLAHEGYPGHLYAWVSAKEKDLSNLATIMTSTGHAEGWATYVQLKLYDYIKENSADEKVHLVMDYLYANQISGYLLESRLDAGIQLEGWGVNDVASYMSFVGYNSDGAEEIYNLLIEIPTQYASYGYGKLVFVRLHEEAKKILGAYYDEVEFNAMLHSNGWTDLQILEETYHDYMETKCHEYGIEFKK